MIGMLIAEGWLGLLEKVAIVCVIAWAIWSLIKWTGWPIPEPVWIIFYAVFSIVVIIWLFELVRMIL